MLKQRRVSTWLKDFVPTFENSHLPIKFCGSAPEAVAFYFFSVVREIILPSTTEWLLEKNGLKVH